MSNDAHALTRRLSYALVVVALLACVAGILLSRPSPQNAASCHSAQHIAGARDYLIYKDAPEEGLAQAPAGAARCGWGYYHAYLEALFEDAPDPLRAAGLCERMAEGREDAPALRRVCYGSAGSGFVRALLPPSGSPVLTALGVPLAEGLRSCERMDAPEFGRSACFGGVFGEIIYRGAASTTSAVVPRDFTSLCRPYDGARAVECYRKAGAGLFLAEGYSMERLAVMVETVPETEAREAFFVEGMEVFLLDPSLRRTQDAFLSECLKVSPASKWCVAALVRGAFDASVSAAPEKEALGACRNGAVRNGSLETICYTEAVELLRNVYAPARLGGICALVPSAWRYLCASK